MACCTLHNISLPETDGSGIEMHKTRPWIIPYPTPLQIRGQGVHQDEVGAKEAHIDRLTLDMHTMLSHAGM